MDTLAGTDTEAPADDLRGDIAALMEEPDVAAEGGTSEVPEPETVASEPNEARADHPTDPLRYADGTFKKTKAEAAAEAAPADGKPVKEQPSTDTQAKPSDAPSTALAAPAGWTAAEKAEWSKLSPVAQAAVSRREAEISRGGQQWSEDKRRYEGMISPIARMAQARGISVEEGAQRLAAAQEALDANPADGIRRIAQSYGVDLATLAGSPAEVSREQSQPDIAMLVRQAVQPILAPIQERLSAEDRQREQSTVDLVTQFSSSPGHEHFDAVQAEMMDLIPSIRARNSGWSHTQILQEAYDRAVYANPTTRDSILSARDAQAETKRQEEAKQRAEKARRAGSSVTGNPSGAPASQSKDSLRAELEAAYSGG
jgi:hypothetical protein